MAYRNGVPIWYGLKGSSDIVGMLNNGKFFAIEVKTGNAKQSEHQANFEQVVRKNNGIYIVARSVQDVLAFLDQYKMHFGA